MLAATSNELKNNSSALSARVLLTHANVFLPATTFVKKDMMVEIVNGSITSIYPSSLNKKLINADAVIDCKGKFGHYQKEDEYKKRGIITAYQKLLFITPGVQYIVCKLTCHEKIALTYC